MAVVSAGEASSSTSRSTYQVFLSFRGKDTRKAFTDHLYTALMQAGIRTFRDDNEIERGENIKSELQKGIQQSRCYIIVFSKDYVSSKWCLDELVMILKCKRTSKHVILPIFYDVDPSEVRKQSGCLAETFARYEKQFKEGENERKNQWMERVTEWRTALKEVADLGGMVLQNQADGLESKFIQKIVKVIEDKLNRTVLSVDPYLIGIDSQARNINSWLQEESTNVSIVAICGIGGIGKTTIAKYVYNINFQKYEGCSFLANIRETSNQPSGLVHLQKQLLSDILQKKIEKIWNVDEGMSKIKNAIGCKSVFIVLDDVDHANQLEAIIGMRKWFCPGSKIIITTRHEGLLKAYEVFKVLKVKELDYYESLELFSWHAFGQDHPIETYMTHSKRVVCYCGGLPLALKVLGSSLYGKSLEAWESAIKKLEAIPDNEILKILKISYDTLQDDHDQDLFLHIALFFIGEEKDFTVKILDQCDFYTIVGIQNLVDRSLLTIDYSNRLMMHQLLREMGREIIRQESPKELGKRSRLWRHIDSFNVLKGKTGTETIESLILDMHMIKEDKCDKVKLETDAFARMQKLKVLQLNYIQLAGSYKEFPKRLRWLCWHGFPLKFLPTDFPLESLVVLDMSYGSLEQSWKGTKFIGGLKILNLSHCHNLVKTPDFSGLPNLETLILKGCVSLVEVHESIGNVEGLVFLDLEDCKNLKKLPKNIVMLKFLETLIISGCSNLFELPGEFQKMKSLKVLCAGDSSRNPLPSTTKEVKSWPSFNWFWALKPKSSPNFFSLASLPNSLVKLSLDYCNLSDDAFPRDLSNLSLLEDLSLCGNPICNLADCTKGLSSLRTLWLCCCGSLQSLVLPNVMNLNMNSCTSSLNKITYQSALFILALESNPGRDNLYGNGTFVFDIKGTVDAEMIKYMSMFNFESMGDIEVKHQYMTLFRIKQFSIQDPPVFSIFSTFVPGINVPSWFSNPCCFSNKSLGSSVSFTVPSIKNLKIRGLNVCSVYALSNTLGGFRHASYAKISNKTKNLNWIYSPIYLGIPETGEDMVWLSHWTFGNELEGGDEVNISISIGGDEFQVKECGIEFVYDDDEQKKKRTKLTHLEFVYDDDEQKKKRTKLTHNTSFSCEQVIDGELFRGTVTSHRLMSWGLSISEDDEELSDNDMGIEFSESDNDME